MAIALVLVGQAAATSYNHVQWFDTLNKLELQVNDVLLIFNAQAQVIVQAAIRNPTGFNGMGLVSVIYVVQVNSTSEPFQGLGGLGVASGTVSYEAKNLLIPPQGSLNITVVLSPPAEIVDSLKTFVNNHQSDLEKFAAITIIVPSSFGRVLLPYCYQLPQHMFTTCPSIQPRPIPHFG